MLVDGRHGLKPLDREMIRSLAERHDVLITGEEGSIGGFGSFVMQFLSEEGLLDGGLKMRSLVLPDSFIDHAKPDRMYAQAGLDAKGIVAKVLDTLGRGQARPRSLSA